MSSRIKRRRSEDFLLKGEATDLLIKTADSEQPLEAHLVVLLPCSKVVRDLPRASSGKTTWDLSQLVLEGQSSPVASAVVRQWLDLVYSRVDGTQRPPDFPSLSEAARSLLLFADAVGTCSLVMDAAGDALASQPGLTLPVTVNAVAAAAGAAGGGGGGAPLQLQLTLSGKLYFFDKPEALCALDAPNSGLRHTVVTEPDLAPHAATLPGAVAAALEGWLYLAGRLGLVALVRRLLDFFKVHLVPRGCSILRGTTPQVFSRRVLECMPHELLVEGFVSGCLADPHIASVDVPAGNKLSLVMHCPTAATWFGQQPGVIIEGDTMKEQGIFPKNAINNKLRASLGGMTCAEHKQALAQVMQQLDDAD